MQRTKYSLREKAALESREFDFRLPSLYQPVVFFCRRNIEIIVKGQIKRASLRAAKADTTHRNHHTSRTDGFLHLDHASLHQWKPIQSPDTGELDEIRMRNATDEGHQSHRKKKQEYHQMSYISEAREWLQVHFPRISARKGDSVKDWAPISVFLEPGTGKGQERGFGLRYLLQDRTGRLQQSASPLGLLVIST